LWAARDEVRKEIGAVIRQGFNFTTCTINFPSTLAALIPTRQIHWETQPGIDL